MNTVISLSVVFGCLRMAGSASTGAKETACADMYPAHSGHGQLTQAPFKIQLTSSTYGCSAPAINVSINSNDLTGFKGFLCQPRTDITDYQTYGSFEYFGDNMTNNCIGEAAVTHTDPSLKTSVSFLWVAPKQNVGAVYIVCTVVKNWTIFWPKLCSDGIRYSNDCSSPASSTTSSSAPTSTDSSPETTPKLPATHSTRKSTTSDAVSSSANSSTILTKLFTNVTLLSTVPTKTNETLTTPSVTSSTVSVTSSGESTVSSTGEPSVFKIATVLPVTFVFIFFFDGKFMKS